jgi:dihydrofolate reductase
MKVSAIVAVAHDLVMGKNNDIPWYLPADLKYFKAMTLNRHIIMGRKTFQSIGRPLPKRTNIVVTRQAFFIATGCIVAHCVEEALEIAHDNGEEEVFIIGGAEIYKQTMPYWDRLFLTEVDLKVDGDTFFPEINPNEWRLVLNDPHPAEGKNEHAYTCKIFERLTNEERE